ncbi:glutamate racemase [Candidatus Desantisbacteria bacterium CG_4_10_14_0_8_um_filter_48_22]|uniref:Glutamate racemase n=1 Tax=Candidatus Desantisbacteria bacterium CG_4_10_14_0_8_um_filter_48_22 TaxID=1974543 RepID=A0A2M7SEH8_9BACT|nr:MAG: glutamate racemase [Candidatus Desantisbacteria bacterium CG1_02_49_89]PIV56556.1 MAG: glutamate racemase [Candidatus Desantisbacteria bacterium CG02_land_8_20_14_3_00_49_13]PIZ17899.1 MAG: glutamate racemase [Candidatus Desantisbacteria bacterium CG_4_10_14_0_8_um_filter_48_22]
MDERPVGIFDSGIGGLTVAREVFNHLPHENVVYFGDTARVPYGTKSADTIRKFCKGNIKFLLTHGVKLVIVACNTASATAMGFLREKFPSVPIIDVIAPAARLAVLCTKNRKIGVIGTESTVSSGSYEREIKNSGPDIKVFPESCPLFVPLVEEGWFNRKETVSIAGEYLKDLKKEKIDTLILGCTHYPLLRETIKKIMGSGVSIVDSGGVASECADVLRERGLANEGKGKGWHKFFVSDNPEKFKKIGGAFLGHQVDSVEKIDIEEYS